MKKYLLTEMKCYYNDGWIVYYDKERFINLIKGFVELFKFKTEKELLKWNK